MAAVDLRRALGSVALAAAVALVASAAGCSDSTGSSGAGSTSTTTATPATTEPAGLQGQPTTIDKVVVGQCVNDVPDHNQRQLAVLLIGCEQPHTYEIYFQFKYPAGGPSMPAGTPYPGETAVRQASEAECYAQFQGWMGSAWTESDFDIQTWWPSKASWNSVNDRRVTCGGYLFSGKKATGSARGTKR